MQPDRLTKAALRITKWIGSPSSIFVHTILFVLCFVAVWDQYFGINEMLLALTTVVSLEAIYLALFIQMTVNFQAASLREVERDIDEIQEDVEEIAEDVDEIQEDVDELQEDVEDIEESDDADEARKAEQKETLTAIQSDLRKLMQDIEKLQVR